MSLANIHMNIFESPGYYILPGLLPDELSRLREVIKAEYIGRISEVYPELVDHCARLDMSEYHKLSMFMDHKLLWGKRKERILTPESVAQISTLSMFSVLDRVFPGYKIFGEAFPELYWRICRPSVKEDIGPVHADSWYWELGNGDTPTGVTRVKLWMPIFAETGLSGLKVLPDSHKNKYNFDKEVRDGLVKPRALQNEESLPLVPFLGDEGTPILFHDSLLHGGFSKGFKTRVSLEFTVLVG